MSGLPFTGFVVPSGGSSSGGSGDVVGPASATDNAIARYDTTTGELLQDSALTVSDVAGGVVTLATTAGNALTIDVLEPAAANGASVAGDPAILQAGDAVASLDTAGAAAGGSLTLRAGDAARNTSGNARGGDIVLDTGAGIGTGVAGQVIVPLGVVGAPGITFSDELTTGLWKNAGAGGNINIATAGVTKIIWNSTGTVLNANLVGNGNRLSGVTHLVEANTAGSGAPNVIAASESLSIYTNEGTTAANYHTLPTAAAGYVFEFIVQDADGIRIVANTDDTIRVIDKVTAAAGYIESTTIGSTVRLVSINAVEWFATSIHGVWTDGTFTFDDTGSTSP